MDTPSSDKSKNIKVSVLYACNASGKTRLSKLFYDQYKEKVLCYNAFIEDLFSWDNDNYVLEIEENAWIFETIKDQGLDRQIIDNFQKFTGSKLEPFFGIPGEKIKFGLHTGDKDSVENIKISRGEESVFIWSIFYTILDAAIEALNETPDNRPATNFNNIQYIVIDDPVSSMDDTRIITIALELAGLISKSKNQLKFLITTHHALFFNVLFNARMNNWDKKNYILSKSGTEIHLETHKKDSPFAYHHVIISEIEEAIANNDLKKYHFNLFRALLEKTANFLGYTEGWKEILSEKEHGKAFIKTLDHYSHNSLSDVEPKDLSEDNKDDFKEAFRFFIQEFKWGISTDA